MDTTDLLAHTDGPVLTLTLNRPEQRNAISPAIIAALSAWLTHAAQTPAIRVIVLTGSGAKAFCAGADLQTGKSFKFDYSQPRAAYADLLRQARATNVPIVGRINGTCMAGGMGLLGICDIAIAADHALFGLPEVKVGVFPMQVLAVLQHLVPKRRLAEMCITGEPIDAAEALAIGLLSRVVPAADLDGAVAKTVASIVDKSPAAIRRGKYAMTAIESASFEETIAFMEGQISLLALTDDAAEGMAAFRDKRKPVWTGR